jgi:hypothetical protein
MRKVEAGILRPGKHWGAVSSRTGAPFSGHLHRLYDIVHVFAHTGSP